MPSNAFPSETCGSHSNVECWSYTVNPLSFESGGIGKYLVVFAIQGVVQIMLLLVLDSGILTTSWYRLTEAVSEKRTIGELDEDGDVKDERSRVQEILRDNKAGEHAVIVDNLSKIYYSYRRHRPNKLAVDRLTFAVSNGECFGLLGMDGAGKTTTFKMIVGDVMMTNGSAYVRGHSVKQELSKV